MKFVIICLYSLLISICYAYFSSFPEGLNGEENVEDICSFCFFPLFPFGDMWWGYIWWCLAVGTFIFLFRYGWQIRGEKCIYEEKENVFFKVIHETYASLAILQNKLKEIADRELAVSLLKEVQEITKHVNVVAERYHYIKLLTEVEDEMQLDFPLVEWELSAYIFSVTKQCGAYASAHQVKVNVHKTFSYTSCWINQITMTAALQYLLEKMIDGTPAGESIDLTLSSTPHQWTLQIAGPAVPSQDNHRSVWRILPLRRMSSWYENMPMVEKIIRLHRGKISIEKQGEMIICKVIVPLSLRLLVKEALPGRSAIGKVGWEKMELFPKEKKPFRLLLIMSNKEMSNYLVQTLSPFYQVIVWESADRLLELLEKEVFHVIIIDEFVGEAKGEELCLKLRAECTHSYIPILLLAEWDDSKSYIAHSFCGANHLHPRMVEIGRLKADIEALIENRAIQRNWIIKLARENYRGKLPDKQLEEKGQRAFLKKVDELLELNLSNEEYTIDLLASGTGMSRTLFYTKVKKYTEDCPEKYVFRFKMNKAAILLIACDTATIIEIAAAVGYSSSEYFARKFKTFHGISPTEYRKRALGEKI